MKKLDLIKILNDVPKGTILYSPIFGNVKFIEIDYVKNIIKVLTERSAYYHFNSEGVLVYHYDACECLLFPSKDNRDWNNFNKEKFDFNTLNHFDKVIVRDKHSVWHVDFFSHIDKNCVYKYVCVGGQWHECMPYNDETKHWVNTYDEIPSKYKEE